MCKWSQRPGKTHLLQVNSTCCRCAGTTCRRAARWVHGNRNAAVLSCSPIEQPRKGHSAQVQARSASTQRASIRARYSSSVQPCVANHDSSESGSPAERKRRPAATIPIPARLLRRARCARGVALLQPWPMWLSDARARIRPPRIERLFRPRGSRLDSGYLGLPCRPRR